MKPIVDLSGRKIGELLIIDRFVFNKKSWWNCLCDCGRKKAVAATHLIQGNTKSCGLCFGMPVKHMPENESWSAMKERCLNKNHEAYHLYGGRGIKICNEWLSDFKRFYKDMGARPEGTSLDRINNDGDYEPGNCKWSSLIEQANNKRTNVIVELNGRQMTVAQAAREMQVKVNTLRSRINRGAECGIRY